MEVLLEKIKVRKRIRKDTGNIGPLADSMQRNGLLNPVLINSRHELLAGYRRYMAAKKLNWQKIEVRMLRTSGGLEELDVELDENRYRKDFTPEEEQEGLRKRNELVKMQNMNPLTRFFYRIWLFLKRIFTRS